MNDKKQIWAQALNHLEKYLSKPSFETWLKNTKLINLDQDKNKAIIEAPNSFARDWLESRYTESIKETLYFLNKKYYKIEFVELDDVIIDNYNSATTIEDAISVDKQIKNDKTSFMEEPTIFSKIDALLDEQRRTNKLLEKIIEKSN